MALYPCTDEGREIVEKVKSLNLPELFIVSKVILDKEWPDAENICGKGTNFDSINIEVMNAPGEKCPRCWMHSEEANAEGLCPRCAKVMADFVTEE